MEQIERRDGIIYYGSKACSTADEAYLLFRDSYNKSVGRVSYYRLNRLGNRKERVHGYGFVFSRPRDCPEYSGRFPVWLLGILSGAYCRMLDGRYIPEGTEEDTERWIDWVFEKGKGRVYLVGIKQKTGRTSKRLKTRFK